MRIALLPGDGIGPEVAAAARRVLESLPLEVEIEEHPFGGAAIHAAGTPLPDGTLHACRRSDAVLLAAVGLPEFDVLVMENTFGDILSDVAAGVTGGLGLAASASLGESGPGIFEPVHGSAPDIAGTRKANPAGMLRSLALALEHGLGEPALARALEAAVDKALEQAPTPDVGGTATTSDFGDVVLASLEVAVR